ncbi:MAG TPA: alginate lyase family protein [Bryobacteraceae bacterium]|nr:alginate lyase family protein [Bryobacteraceae bacterium]
MTLPRPMPTRRHFMATSALAVSSRLLCSQPLFPLGGIERPRVLKLAEKILGEQPITVTAYHSTRSAGGPYSYSLFNLEAMAGICQVLSTSGDDLWTYTLPDGRGMARAEAFMYPYIADKSKWPYPHDVMYFDMWPLREQSLLFAGLALDRPEYLDLWKKLNEIR